MSKPSQGFRHYRHRSPIHASQVSTRGGVTMAFAAPVHIQDLTAEHTVRVAFSFCSGEDNFERTRGRIIAETRLTATDARPLEVPGDEFLEILHAVDPCSIHLSGLDTGNIRAWNIAVRKTIGTC